MKNRRELPGVLILLFVSVILLGVVALTAFHDGKMQSHYEELDEGWLVTKNGEVCPGTMMNTLVFPLADRGDTFELETILPDRSIANPILVFFSVHSTITVELDGEEIYHYGQEFYEAGKLTGYGYQCINLPEDYEGRTLCVRLTVCEDAAFSSFDTPQIYDANWYVKDYLKENRIPLIINLFLVVFGICMLGVALVFTFSARSTQWLKLLWVALFSIDIGLWSICSYNLTFLFFDDLRLKVLSEFGLLYLLPISVFAYFYEDMMREGGRVRKGVYWGILALQILFTLSAYILQMTGLCRFPKLLKVQHLIMGMMVIYLVWMFVSDIRHKRLKNAVLFAGVVVMVSFAVTDLVRFNVEKYISMASGRRYVGGFSIGVMIFIVSMMIDFSRNVTRALYDAAEGEALKKLAYTDALTGLANRRSCEDAFDELDADTQKKEYAVAVFDLNNLKQVNDGLGHEEGDAFIKSFGDILREVFSRDGLVGRTGGDEFLVILNDVPTEKINMLIRQMEELIEKKNREHLHWNLSTAYGIGEHGKEPEKSARQLYKLADERMYACKQDMKQKSAASNGVF